MYYLCLCLFDSREYFPICVFRVFFSHIGGYLYWFTCDLSNPKTDGMLLLLLPLVESSQNCNKRNPILCPSLYISIVADHYFSSSPCLYISEFDLLILGRLQEPEQAQP